MSVFQFLIANALQRRQNIFDITLCILQPYHPSFCLSVLASVELFLSVLQIIHRTLSRFLFGLVPMHHARKIKAFFEKHHAVYLQASLFFKIAKRFGKQEHECSKINSCYDYIHLSLDFNSFIPTDYIHYINNRALQ